MSIALSRAQCRRQARRLVWRRVHHRARHQTLRSRIALAALPGAYFPRLRALALSDAGSRSAWLARMRRQKTYTGPAGAGASRFGGTFARLQLDRAEPQ